MAIALTRPGRTGQPPVPLVLEVLVLEVTDGRLHRGLDRVAQRAERAPGDVAADVEELVQVSLAALALLELLEQLDTHQLPSRHGVHLPQDSCS